MPAPTVEQMAHWPAPNYINPSTRVPAVIAVMVVFTTLMVPFLITRIYIRLKIRGGVKLDDWIILTAAVCI
jgi:hypothetical protein